MTRSRSCPIAGAFFLLGLATCAGAAHRPKILSTYGSYIGAGGPTQRREAPHDGVDLKGDPGTSVFSSLDGVVSWVFTDTSSGTTITIASRESDPIWMSYSHLRSVLLTEGAVVKRGDKLGEIGLFAHSGGVSHVHWRFCRDEACHQTIDPLQSNPRCLLQTAARDVTTIIFPIKC
jgi:murein DD-endopeptidase MepM/ murein hydrolase activator NlpD